MRIGAAVIDELLGREVSVVARKPFLDRAPEQRLVARGGDLIVVRQAGRVDVGGAAHAQRVGLLRHQLGELVLVAAEIFGDGHRGVVRRLGDHRLDRVFDGDGLAGLEPSFVGACSAACSETLSGVSSLILPASSRSNSR